MKVNIASIIFCFIFSLFIIYFIREQIQTTATLHSGLVAYASIKVTPTPATATPTPTLSEKITGFEESIFDPIFAALKLIAAIAGSLLIILLCHQSWKLSRMTNLVIAPINNATGDDDLNKVLIGLNRLIREGFIDVIEDVRESNTKYKINLDQPLDQFPPPIEILDGQLTNILDSLGKATSGDTFKSGEIRTVLQILGLVLIPHGSRITITLQKSRHTPSLLGMSVEIVDLQSKQKPTLRSIWEPRYTSYQVISTQVDVSTSSSTPENILKQTNPSFQLHLQLDGIIQYMQKSLPFHKEDKPQNEQLDMNNGALAHYKLGQVYQARGDLDEAKSHYESALLKQPDNSDIVEALKSVLDERKTLEERYLRLRRPVKRWIALEIVKRSMEAHLDISWVEERRKHYLSRVYNFIGAFHQSSSLTYPEHRFFYELAIDDFEKAIKYDEHWFQPFENLATTYVMMAQGVVIQGTLIAAKSGSEATRCLYQAISAYEKTLELYKEQYKNNWTTKNLPKQHTKLREKLSFKQQQQVVTLNKTEYISILYRIKIGKAIAQLLTNDPNRIEEAKKTIEEITQGQQEWKARSELDSQLLYNLACWYGIAYATSLDVQAAEKQARLYLAYSIVRDQARYHLATIEASFTRIASPKGLEMLNLRLLEGCIIHNDLQKAQDETFTDVINEILSTISWQ